MQRNQQAMAIASKRAVAKSRKIKSLGITPDMTLELQDSLVLSLADDKASKDHPAIEFIKGQEWYVQDLIRFSALDAAERLEFEYNQAFPEVASEEEVVDVLNPLMEA